MNASSGYQNLKLDEGSSYFTLSSCLFCRYRSIIKPFGAALAGDMFQMKTEELFSGMPNVVRTADDNLIAGFDEQGMDHDDTLEKVL